MDKGSKIIFTVTNDLGTDQRMRRICSALSDAGFDVELVGRRLPSSVALSSLSYKQTRLYCLFKKGFLFYAEYNLRLFFYLLFRSTDVYSSVDADTIFPCMLAAKIRSKKLVFDAHEYFTEVPEVYERKGVKWFWEQVSKICIPQADAAYTVSQSLSEILSEHYHQPFGLIRNVPVLEERSSDISTEQHKVILYQGDLNVGRGLEESIMAMLKVDAVLWIAGDGPIKPQLEQLVRDLRLNNVQFLGRLSPHELKLVTKQAYVGLNLLRANGMSYYYSLANKFFDYMHAGVPSLCAAFPEYRLINDEWNVALLCSCDSEEVSIQLNRILSDTELHHTLSRNCLLAAHEFNWQKECEKLVSIYSEL